MRDAIDCLIRGWDITPRLGEITVPALALVGRHGMATPVPSESIARGIPRSTLVVY